MKGLAGLGLIVVLVIVGVLTYLQLQAVPDQVRAVNTAAGNVATPTGQDPKSPTPMTHCYGGELDSLPMKARIDFEARTSKGWVSDPASSQPGKFCIKESQQAVDERLRTP